jgi:hypothetical protein
MAAKVVGAIQAPVIMGPGRIGRALAKMADAACCSSCRIIGRHDTAPINHQVIHTCAVASYDDFGIDDLARQHSQQPFSQPVTCTRNPVVTFNCTHVLYHLSDHMLVCALAMPSLQHRNVATALYAVCKTVVLPDFQGPIYVCTTNDALPAVVASVAPSQLQHLVLFQNGMLLPWLEAQRLQDVTQVLLYMSGKQHGTRSAACTHGMCMCMCPCMTYAL